MPGNFKNSDRDFKTLNTNGLKLKKLYYLFYEPGRNTPVGEKSTGKRKA